VSPRRLVVGVLIAGATFALVGAIAAAKIKTRSNSTTIAAQQFGSTTAKCPKGSEPVAGGFASPGFDPTFMTGPGIVATTSKRAGHHAWKTGAFNFGAPSASTGKEIGFAYCDTHKPRLRQVSSGTTSVPAFGNGSATATCPGGSEAVSGGVIGFGPLDATVIPFTSKRVGDHKWKVVAFNNDQTNAEKLTAFAYCDKHEPGLRKESNHVTVPQQEKRSATAKCGRGEKAYSGGYAAKVDQQADGAFAFTSKKTKGGDWTGAAEGNGDSPGPFTVFAYCKT
jgi:hypothetical protein